MSSSETTPQSRTSQASTTSPTSQALSPLSPTGLSINRFEAYIDKVRQLESENKRLRLRFNTSQNTVDRDVTSVRNSYEKELTDTRQLLDESAREKTTLQSDIGRLRTELGELNLK